MAATTLVLAFTYKNGDEFKLQANVNGAGNVTIIEMSENGDIGKIFDKGLKNSLTDYFERRLDEIIAVMKG